MRRRVAFLMKGPILSMQPGRKSRPFADQPTQQVGELRWTKVRGNASNSIADGSLPCRLRPS